MPALLLALEPGVKALALGSLATIPYDLTAGLDNPASLAYFHRWEVHYTGNGRDNHLFGLMGGARRIRAAGYLGIRGEAQEVGLGLGARVQDLAAGLLVEYGNGLRVVPGLALQARTQPLGRLAGGLALRGDTLAAAASLITGWSIPYVVLLNGKNHLATGRWAWGVGVDISLRVLPSLDMSWRGSWSSPGEWHFGLGLSVEHAALDWSGLPSLWGITVFQ